jgi:hypothetical protein
MLLPAPNTGGVTLTMMTIFLLGILATKAEPALNVLGETVETLSGGMMTKKALIYAVCVGVAVGMCAGESYRLCSSCCMAKPWARECWFARGCTVQPACRSANCSLLFMAGHLPQ